MWEVMYPAGNAQLLQGGNGFQGSRWNMLEPLTKLAANPIVSYFFPYIYIYICPLLNQSIELQS